MLRSAESASVAPPQEASRHRRLVLEAACWLVAAKVMLWLVPFSRIAPALGVAGLPELVRPVASGAERELASAVSGAVGRAASLLPCALVCLPRALAASQMLYRRGQWSELHFGATEGRMGAASVLHAWLTVGLVEVTGFPVARSAKELGVYTRRGRPGRHR